MKAPGTLWIISAPSGGGKTSLVNTLLAQMPSLEVSISHTTRAPRVGEVDGKNYFFVDEASFQAQEQQGIFLEHAKVFNHWYGTSKKWVVEQLRAGIDVILEIDWQGARTIREKISCQSIFILPPSREALQNRLESRQQDSAKIIQARMDQAAQEISHYPEYDYVIVNDDFALALHELKAIILAQRLKVDQQKIRHAVLINSLLAEFD